MVSLQMFFNFLLWSVKDFFIINWTVVSFLFSITATLITVRLLDNHNKMLIQPYLELGFTHQSEKFGSSSFYISNHGNGLAIIKSLKVFYKTKTYDLNKDEDLILFMMTFPPELKDLIGVGSVDYCGFDKTCDILYLKSKVRVSNQEAQLFWEHFLDIGFDIRFESIFGDQDFIDKNPYFDKNAVFKKLESTLKR